jgi:hypothetical protein
MIRSTSTNVIFRFPLRIEGLETELPAGIYRTTVDAEKLEGLSFLAYRAVGVFIEVPAVGSRVVMSQLLPIERDELEAAIWSDRRRIYASGEMAAQ